MLARRKVIWGFLLAPLAALGTWLYRSLRALPPSEVADFAVTKDNHMMSSAIRQKFPLGFQWPTLDPFLFCVHHHDFYPKGNDIMGPAVPLTGRKLGEDFEGKDGFRMYHGERIPGFPVHPHRGFETITVVRKGYVDHSDSLGAAGRYGEGDVQWMTAGKGVQHSEMFPLLRKDRENTLELFQIWLNLPARSKMVDAHFKMFWSEKIPTVDAGTGGARVQVIAGEFDGVQPPTPPPDSWAFDPANGVALWLVKMPAGSKMELPVALAGAERMIYYFEGESLKLGSDILDAGHGALMNAQTGPLAVEAGAKDSQFLVMQARPIGEKVVQYGPFVMNSEAEIRATMDEYRQTEFGGWPWATADMVHGQKGRFARYPDGRETKPEEES